jgi:hypothetical protein
VGVLPESSEESGTMIVWGAVYDKAGNEVDAYYHHNEADCIGALIVERDALRSTGATAISTLENYGQHHSWCNPPEGVVCNCGWDSARAELRQLQGHWCIYHPQTDNGKAINLFVSR